MNEKITKYPKIDKEETNDKEDNTLLYVKLGFATTLFVSIVYLGVKKIHKL
jgi:hypothetical protein